VSASEYVSLNLPAKLPYLHVPGACMATFLEAAQERARPQSLIHGLQLAVYEVCTNIVLHAYGSGKCTAAHDEGGRIQVVFTVTPQPALLTIDLYDAGCSFDITRVPEPDISEPQTRGYGLYLVRQLVDELHYEAEPGSNHWRLTKRL
jgi:serine/threonine-protein kinase RsbW